MIPDDRLREISDLPRQRDLTEASDQEANYRVGKLMADAIRELMQDRNEMVLENIEILSALQKIHHSLATVHDLDQKLAEKVRSLSVVAAKYVEKQKDIKTVRYGWSSDPQTDAELQAKYGDSVHRRKPDDFGAGSTKGTEQMGSNWAICGWCAGTGGDGNAKCPKCHGAGGKHIEKRNHEHRCDDCKKRFDCTDDLCQKMEVKTCRDCGRNSY